MNYLRHTDFIWFESKALHGNAMGNDPVKLVSVLRPWCYDSTKKYPTIWMLDGFAGTGFSQMSSGGKWGEAFADELLQLQQQGIAPPCFFVFPDASTHLGGSQFIDTPYVGNYASYLWLELLPHLENIYPMRAEARARLVTGHSSGGYGALLAAFLHPGIFGAVIASAADCGFEWSLRPSLLPAAIALNKAGGIERWLIKKLKNEPMGKWSKEDFSAFLILAMASVYSPNQRSDGYTLPIDLNTLELTPEVWQRWLAWDPLALVETRGAALRALNYLQLDCGAQDEYGAQFGQRLLSAQLKAQGISHLHTEFPGTHRSTRFRYAERLAGWAARCLQE